MTYPPTAPFDPVYDDNPCVECRHRRYKHSHKGGCLAPGCGCRIRKGHRWAFGLRQERGREVPR